MSDGAVTGGCGGADGPSASRIAEPKPSVQTALSSASTRVTELAASRRRGLSIFSCVKIMQKDPQCDSNPQQITTVADPNTLTTTPTVHLYHVA